MGSICNTQLNLSQAPAQGVSIGWGTRRVVLRAITWNWKEN